MSAVNNSSTRLGGYFFAQRKRTSDLSTETEIAVIKQKQLTMEEHLKANDAAIAALVEERNKALKWGIISLGSAPV
jgi:hypothetical protein